MGHVRVPFVALVLLHVGSLKCALRPFVGDAWATARRIPPNPQTDVP